MYEVDIKLTISPHSTTSGYVPFKVSLDRVCEILGASRAVKESLKKRFRLNKRVLLRITGEQMADLFLARQDLKAYHSIKLIGGRKIVKEDIALDFTFKLPE